MQIASLHVYPLKSAAGHRLSEARIWSTGIEDDRRFVLVDPAGRFLTQRRLPALALLRISLSPVLSLSFRDKILTLPEPEGQVREIQVWADRVPARDWGDAAAHFLRECLGEELRLCERLPDRPRVVPTEYTAGQNVPYYFADGFPFLIVSEAALDLLNHKLGLGGHPPVGIDRFRPNIVIAGVLPHAEDDWLRLRVGENVEFLLAKPCSRCTVITIDQKSAQIGREPLPTLARYRSQDGKIMFGQNAYLLRGEGELLTPGQHVEVLDYRSPRA